MPQEEKTWCRTGSSASQWQLPNESDYPFVCRVAEEKHQRGELETHHQLVDTYIRH